MATVDVKNLNNEVVGKLDLADSVFAGPVNEGLMHLAVKQYLAGLRAGTHKTKTRAEVSGSGTKPPTSTTESFVTSALAKYRPTTIRRSAMDTAGFRIRSVMGARLRRHSGVTGWVRPALFADRRRQTTPETPLGYVHGPHS